MQHILQQNSFFLMFNSVFFLYCECVFVRLFAVSEKLSENVQIVANEPSLAFFRIQEHVHKTMPPLVDKKVFLLYRTL